MNLINITQINKFTRFTTKTASYRGKVKNLTFDLTVIDFF